MAAQAMGKALDEAGSFSLARFFNGFVRGLAHRQEIIAIYGGSGNGICLGVLGEPFNFRMSRQRRKFGIAVVLADEDDRQVPQTRDVQRFVKSTRLAGTIAEEDAGDLSRG